MKMVEQKQIQVDFNKLEASICKDSFFEFVKRFWGTIIPEIPVWNWHIKFLCDELQSVAQRVFRREPKKHDLIINISPGTTKSTICSVMFPAWCWTNDPTIRIIAGSYAFPLSLHLATQSRNVINSDKFKRLFFQLDLVEEQKSLLANQFNGQRIATSTGGSITGMHGHFLIIDDPLNPKEAVSKIQLKGANDWIDQTLMTRKIDRKITPLILIMQRLHQDDPTGHLLKRGEGTVRHICLPARHSINIKPRRCRNFYKNGVMDSVRLDEQVLKEAERELGQYAFAGQFMQHPIPLEGGMFHIAKIKIGIQPRHWKTTIRYWDKAGTEGGGAYTVGAKIGLDMQGRFWVLDIRRGQWDSFHREEIIKETAMMDGKGVIIAVEQEPGSGGKESAQSTVRHLAGWRVRVDRPTGDKVLRADPYSVQVNGGNVFMIEAPWNSIYLSELEFFPFSKYKDQVDASSGAFAQLTKKAQRIGALQ